MRSHFYRLAEHELTEWYRVKSDSTKPYFQQFAISLDTNDFKNAVNLTTDQMTSANITIKPKAFVRELAGIVTKINSRIIPADTAKYARIWYTKNLELADSPRYSSQQTQRIVYSHLDRIIEEGNLGNFFKSPDEFLPSELYNKPNQRTLTQNAIVEYLTFIRKEKRKTESNIIPFEKPA